MLLKASRRLADEAGETASKRKETPLKWAVEKGRVDAVKRLLAARADPNADLGAPDMLLTTVAVNEGHADVLAVLLAAGAKTKGRGNFTVSALDNSIARGDCEMSGMILGKGGLARGMLDDLQNGDALRMLLRRKNYDMVAWLLQRGLKIGDPGAVITFSFSDTVSEGGLMSGGPGGTGPTIYSPSITRVSNFSTRPALPNTQSGNDLYSVAVLNYSIGKADTALRAFLTMMPRQGDEERFVEIVMKACSELLAAEKKQQRAKVSAEHVVRYDASPLAEASLTGRLPLVRRLVVDAKCPVNEPLSRGRRALHYAAAGNATEVAAFLIDKGAVISAPDNAGLSPLDVALANGAVEVVRLLVAKGARLNVASPHAERLLVEAIRLDLPDVVLPAVRAGVAAKSGAFAVWPARRVAEILGAKACVAALSEYAGGAAEKTVAGAPVAGANELDAPPSIERVAAARLCANPLEYRPAITVRVKALVGPDGRALACLPLDAGVSPALQQTAADKVRRSQFAPPRVGGKPAAAWVAIPVEFAAVEEPFGTAETPAKMTTSVAPRIVSQPPPAYPVEERRAGKEGFVLLSFVVGRDGSVEKDTIDVFRATTRGYAQAAAAAITRWKFNPGMYDGEPVRTRMSIPMQFHLGK